MADTVRPAWADIDLSVIRNNARIMRDTFAPAELCAVVKADGYGHGSVEVAKAALAGGAQRLGVALVEEGRLLRESGIEAPILVLSQPAQIAMREVVKFRLTPTLYTLDGVRALAGATDSPHPVHIKIDTGMNRVGVKPQSALDVVEAVVAERKLIWEGLYTHFAVADEPDDDFTKVQAQRFDEVIESLGATYELPPLIHACNTAGGISFVDQRRSLVRCGVGIYGVAPSNQVSLPQGVRPAMTVSTQVSLVKRLQAGESISYGQRFTLDRPANIATIPLGYADGIFRILGSKRCDVLIGGKRHPMAGNVTMDQTMIDCGDEPVAIGDEVVLLGRQGSEEVTANEWADLAGTIGYEVICRIGPRLPRRYG